MILNFVLFPFFTFILFSIGTFFSGLSNINNAKYYKINFKRKSEYYFFERLLYAIFFISFYCIIFNIFLPLNNIFLYISLTFILLLSFIYLSKADLKIFKENFILILLISLIPGIMVPGYDAGLYHIPYQTWIKNYELLLGFSSLNLRFSLGSIYNYFSAILWFDNIFLFVSYFSSIFYLILFLFLKEFLVDNYKKLIFGFLILLTIPLWDRYIHPSYSLVDAPFGIIVIITLTYFFFNINKIVNGESTSREIILLTILFSLLISIKSSGILFLPLFLFFYFFLLIKLDKKNKIIFPVIFLILFSSVWIFRGFIISGCLFYPIEATCFNVSWLDVNNLNYVNTEVGEYTFKPYKLAKIDNLIDKNLILIFCSLIFFLFFYYSILKVTFKLKNKTIVKYLIFFLSIIYIFFVYQLDDLRGFSLLVESKEYLDIQKIILIELKNILLIFLTSFFLIFISFKSYINQIELKFFLKKEIIIFLYLISLFLVWIFKAPHPRFAYGFIPLVLPMIFIIFFNFKNNKLIKKHLKVYNFTIYIFVTSLFYNEINLNSSLLFDLKTLDSDKVEIRENFGLKPTFQNLCWNYKDCYIGEDKKIAETKYFFREIKN